MKLTAMAFAGVVSCLGLITMVSAADQQASAEPLRIAQMTFPHNGQGLSQPTREQLEGDQTTVRLVQRRLNELGYNAGTENGRWNRQTETALVSFEKAKGMSGLGWLSQDVLAELGITAYRDVGLPEK